MSIVTTYLKNQEYFEQKYGFKTIVLFQEGSFYEIYGYDPKLCVAEDGMIDKQGGRWPKAIGKAEEVSLLLNITLTRPHPDDPPPPHTIENCWKAGFPMIAYDKHKSKLISSGYVVVQMDQVKNGKIITRTVTEVTSDLMDLDNVDPKSANNNICTLYLEYLGGKNNEEILLAVGGCALDILSGKPLLAEMYSKKDDAPLALQDIYRFITTTAPREIVIWLHDFPEAILANYNKYLNDTLHLVRYERVLIKSSIPKDYLHNVYQNQLLTKLYNLERPIELLNLATHQYSTTAMVLTFQHCYEHNNDILNRLERPELSWLDADQHLIIAHNGLQQLNFDRLFKIIDKTCTKMGQRHLLKLLQNPLKNPTEIEQYYRRVGAMTEAGIRDLLQQRLHSIPDLVRLLRKLHTNKMTPRDCVVFYRGYLKVIEISCELIKVPTLTDLLFTNEVTDNFNNFIRRLSSLINFDALEKCRLDTTEDRVPYLNFEIYPFNQGIFPEFDLAVYQMQQAQSQIEQIVAHLNQQLQDNAVELEAKRGKVGASKKGPASYEITCTVSKAKKITILLNGGMIDRNLCGEIGFEEITKNERRITSTKIDQLLTLINSTKNHLRFQLYSYYQSLLNEIKQYTFFNAIHQMLALVDVICCYSEVAQKYRYNRPQLVDGDQLTLENLRHPIIERIIDEPYVTNDLYFDKDDTRGYLIFGQNQVGKSSLTKAVGLNLLLAQAGCYTPSTMRYRPYSKIITRLNSQDDITTGESTYAVEMKELRTILRQADDRTLVLGDEIAHTTDTYSSTGITVAAVMSLLEIGASFIFATHMHEVVDLPQIKDCKQFKIAHLSMSKENGKIIYQRKLLPGSGEKFYGVMVAESLGLPDTFIKTAYDVVKQLKGMESDLLSTKKSNYNRNVYMDKCANCGSTTNLHSHHIVEQNAADKDGIIQVAGLAPFNKNIKSNLQVLCQTCHQNHHSVKI